MPSTYTTNTNLELQATGENSGTWGSKLNADDFTIIDSVFGNVQTISLSGADVTLTTSQTQVNFIKLTGTLTANVSVIFPAIGRTYAIQNACTGSYTVTLKISGGGSSAIVPKNTNGVQAFVLDGTNVYADASNPPGAVSMFAQASAPPGWLICDGSAISRTTYAALFSAIGTTYGSGDGSTTFNIPDARGYFPRDWDDGAGRDSGRAIGTTQASAVGPHTHSMESAGAHTHTLTFSGSYGAYPTIYTPGGGALEFCVTGGNQAIGTIGMQSAGTHTHTIDSNGGADTRPINIAFMFAIKV